jgi:hypothetical protein
LPSTAYRSVSSTVRVLDDDEEDEDAVGAEAVAPFVAPPPLDELPPDAPNESPPPDALVVTDCGAGPAEPPDEWPLHAASNDGPRPSEARVAIVVSLRCRRRSRKALMRSTSWRCIEHQECHGVTS